MSKTQKITDPIAAINAEADKARRSADKIGIMSIKSANQWVDDALEEPDPKRYFYDLLVEGECTVLFASSNAGKSVLAIQMAENKKYDIIFLDKRMPDTDGVEIFRKIREDKSGTNADTVFIMLTAEEGSDIRQKALSEGFSDYMPKPFSPQSLEEILRRHLLPEKIKMNG